MVRARTAAIAIAVVLAACQSTGDAPTITDDAATSTEAPSSAADSTTPPSHPPSPPAASAPDEPASSAESTSAAVDEIVVSGAGDVTVASDPFTTDGTLRGFVVEGSSTGSDRSQIVLWLAEVGASDATTPPEGCVGVSGEPPDLGVEDEAEDGSDGCALLQLLLFEPDTGPAGGLGEPIPAGTWQIWAVPYGSVPPWRVTYRSCQDTVDANPSLFGGDEPSGEFCSGD